MAIDLICVESFLVLARHRHFSRAATALYLTPSALSKRIHRLEDQLGETLVIRTRGQCAGLTPSGERFVHAGRELLEASTAAASFSHDPHVRPGRFVIGLMGAVTDHVPASHLRVAKACIESRCPVDVSFSGIPYGSDDISLHSHIVDLVLTCAPPTHAGLKETPLRPLIREVVVPEDHDLVARGHASVDDLTDQRIIIDTEASTQWMSPWTLGDIDIDLPTVAIPVRTMAQITDAVFNRVGIAIVAATVRHCLPPGLIPLALHGVPPITARATYRRDDHRPALFTAIDILSTLAAAWPNPGNADSTLYRRWLSRAIEMSTPYRTGHPKNHTLAE